MGTQSGKPIARSKTSEVSEEELRRVKQQFRRFFEKVALPYLNSVRSPGGRRARSKELAEMAMEYFFEPGKARWLEEFCAPGQTADRF